MKPFAPLMLLTYVSGVTAGSFLVSNKPRIELLVERSETKDGVTTLEATPYVATPMTFDSVGGTPPQPKEVLFCGADIERTKFADHVDQQVVLACEGGRTLTLTQVDFK